MGTIASLIAGAGLVTIWSAFWEPDPAPPRSKELHDRLRDRLNQAGMHDLSILGFSGVCMGLGLVSWVVALSLTTSLAIASALGILLGLSPMWYVSFSARKRRTEISGLWPEAIEDLISAIRAGMSLPEALSGLADRGPEALRPFFADFAADYRATGRFNHCLDTLKHRIADPDADRIIEALRITREVGGTDLTRLLATLAQFLREDLNTRRELVARQSWTTAGARLATAAPWIVLALLSTRQETAQAFDSPPGIAILAAGALMSGAAYVLMVRLGRLPEEERVLR
ncbi:MAG TPA: type II secretion system F family protein [Beutenbergiaceae bacterium]|nr:type II secretion system F family protein [Beutenbergiaceae bacterium]